MPKNFFVEHIDYFKMEREKLGKGANGEIFACFLTSDRTKKMALKEVGLFCVKYQLLFAYIIIVVGLDRNEVNIKCWL